MDASNRYRTGTSLPNANCSRALTRVAINESPPRAKKSIIEPDPLHAQHLGEDPGDDLFGLGLRRPEGCGGKHRCRQRLTVDLARGGQRELLEHHNLRRHHVIGQPRAQPLTHRADLGVGVGVVGVGAALVGPGGGQVEVGQRCGVLAPASVGLRKTASRVPGCGAPGDRDVVSGGFAEAVQLFGGGGVGGRGGAGLGQCVGQG